jgi:hypothetical protein
MSRVIFMVVGLNVYSKQRRVSERREHVTPVGVNFTTTATFSVYCDGSGAVDTYGGVEIVLFADEREWIGGTVPQVVGVVREAYRIRP